jgi:hypothetical protein
MAADMVFKHDESVGTRRNEGQHPGKSGIVLHAPTCSVHWTLSKCRPSTPSPPPPTLPACRTQHMQSHTHTVHINSMLVLGVQLLTQQRYTIHRPAANPPPHRGDEVVHDEGGADEHEHAVQALHAP